MLRLGLCGWIRQLVFLLFLLLLLLSLLFFVVFLVLLLRFLCLRGWRLLCRCLGGGRRSR